MMSFVCGSKLSGTGRGWACEPAAAEPDHASRSVSAHGRAEARGIPICMHMTGARLHSNSVSAGKGCAQRADEQRVNISGCGHRAFMHDHPVNPEAITNLTESRSKETLLH